MVGVGGVEKAEGDVGRSDSPTETLVISSYLLKKLKKR